MRISSPSCLEWATCIETNFIMIRSMETSIWFSWLEQKITRVKKITSLSSIMALIIFLCHFAMRPVPSLKESTNLNSQLITLATSIVQTSQISPSKEDKCLRNSIDSSWPIHTVLASITVQMEQKWSYSFKKLQPSSSWEISGSIRTTMLTLSKNISKNSSILSMWKRLWL